MRIDVFETILACVGILLVGLAFFIVLARVTGISGRRDDKRKEFFRLVEIAREAEILEKKPISYNLVGSWKGEGDGYFGIARFIELELEQNQSEIHGRLIDHFGYSIIRGFFVWPYIWFDLERHGTIFEFRGVLEESPDGTTINGNYRYFQDDAIWSVKRITGSSSAPPAVATLKAQEKDAATAKAAAATKKELAESRTQAVEAAKLGALVKPKSDVVDSILPSDNDLENSPANPFRKHTEEQNTIAAAADAKMAALSGAISADEKAKDLKAVPTGDIDDRTKRPRKISGRCPDCNAEIDELFSFCIYCGKKKE